MIKLLQFLWTGCWHKWECDGRGPFTDSRGENIGYYYIFHCVKCNRHKLEKIT